MYNALGLSFARVFADSDGRGGAMTFHITFTRFVVSSWLTGVVVAACAVTMFLPELPGAVTARAKPRD